MTGFVAIALPSYDTPRMRLLLTLLMFAGLALFSGTAAAFELEQYQGATDLHVAQADGMSLSEAIEFIRRRTGGKVVSAETKVQGGREVHHIKVFTKEDGKVKTHRVNGRRR